MSEETISPLRHTVSVNRKITPKQYESLDTGIFLQFETPADMPIEEIMGIAAERIIAAKTTVLDSLGIDYTLVDGVVVEATTAPKATFKGPDAVTQIRNEFGGGTVEPDNGQTYQTAHAGDLSDVMPSDNKAKKAWLKARLASHPNEFFDNREDKASGKYSSKSPDFKHKPTKEGLWLD